MSKNSRQKRDLAASQRGLIIQRVLIDGRTPAEAGAPFGVEEREVARWVLAYKRHGMASLHGEVAAELFPRRWLRGCFVLFGTWLRGLGGAAAIPPARPLSERPAAEDPTRRSHWN
jgi:hypothetical protein